MGLPGFRLYSEKISKEIMFDYFDTFSACRLPSIFFDTRFYTEPYMLFQRLIQECLFVQILDILKSIFAFNLKVSSHLLQ